MLQGETTMLAVNHVAQIRQLRGCWLITWSDINATLCPSLGTPVARAEVDTAVAEEPGLVWWSNRAERSTGRRHLGWESQQVMERWRQLTPVTHRRRQEDLGGRIKGHERQWKTLILMIQCRSSGRSLSPNNFTKRNTEWKCWRRCAILWWMKYGTLISVCPVTEAPEGVRTGSTSPTFLTNQTIGA